jgi:heme/copper-type cytochrome/quinol oxidase subunit 4
VVLLFSYAAFSYDIFNYIFDAKIWTYYGKNPYEFKALDFPNDPMLSFMHWTHRVYPYGPVWLFITIPISYVGFSYFLLTYFLFKVVMVVCFLATVWFIQKILQVIAPKNVLFGVAFFALNPFVLIESLVSSHNDIVMLCFFMCGMYLLIKKRYVLTFIVLVLGYGIKFASATYPLFIHAISIIGLALSICIFFYVQKKGKFRWEIFFMICTILMIIPVVLASLRTNFQPWYFLSLLPFAALAGKKYYIVVPSIMMSYIVLFEYVPYLYLGNWNSPVPGILQSITMGGIFLAIVSVFVIAGYKKLLR